MDWPVNVYRMEKRVMGASMKVMKPMILAAILVCSAIFFLPEPPEVLANSISSGAEGGNSSIGSRSGSSRGSSGGSSRLESGSSNDGGRLQQDSRRLMYDHEREELKRQEEEERRNRGRRRAPDPPARQATPAPSGN